MMMLRTLSTALLTLAGCVPTTGGVDHDVDIPDLPDLPDRTELVAWVDYFDQGGNAMGQHTPPELTIRLTILNEDGSQDEFFADAAPGSDDAEFSFRDDVIRLTEDCIEINSGDGLVWMAFGPTMYDGSFVIDWQLVFWEGWIDGTHMGIEQLNGDAWLEMARCDGHPIWDETLGVAFTVPGEEPASCVIK